MLITKSCCRAVPDDRFGVQNYHTCIMAAWILVSQEVPCLGKSELWNIEKWENAIFMQSPGSWCLAMQGKLLCRTITSVNKRIGSTLYSKKKRVLHRQRARIHVQIRNVDLHFVYLEEHKFVFYWIIYWQELRADTWPGEGKFFQFSLEISSPENGLLNRWGNGCWYMTTLIGIG